ncbi:MAG: hypothetical protein ABR555_12345, partial [Pyrinomonadaceae bacterium]
HPESRTRRARREYALADALAANGIEHYFAVGNRFSEQSERQRLELDCRRTFSPFAKLVLSMLLYLAGPIPKSGPSMSPAQYSSQHNLEA